MSIKPTEETRNTIFRDCREFHFNKRTQEYECFIYPTKDIYAHRKCDAHRFSLFVVVKWILGVK